MWKTLPKQIYNWIRGVATVSDRAIPLSRTSFVTVWTAKPIGRIVGVWRKGGQAGGCTWRRRRAKASYLYCLLAILGLIQQSDAKVPTEYRHHS
eukprot:109111-Amphidinium_carterae.1